MPIPLTLPCREHLTREMMRSSEPTIPVPEAHHGTTAAATTAEIGVVGTPVAVETGVEVETGVAEAIGKRSGCP